MNIVAKYQESLVAIESTMKRYRKHIIIVVLFAALYGGCKIAPAVKAAYENPQPTLRKVAAVAKDGYSAILDILERSRRK
jgi:Na+-translocating ferredoxin:NAD+ oxidoreductase RnfG subunit